MLLKKTNFGDTCFSPGSDDTLIYDMNLCVWILLGLETVSEAISEGAYPSAAQ